MLAKGSINGIGLGRPDANGRVSAFYKADISEELKNTRDTNSKYVITTDFLIDVMGLLGIVSPVGTAYRPTMNLSKMVAKFKGAYKYDPAPGVAFAEPPADIDPNDVWVPPLKVRKF